MAAENGLVPSEDGKKMNCSFCNCLLPSTAKNFINAHISGKKHIYNVQNQQNKKNKIKRSIYVKGFDPLIPCLEKELKNFFKALQCEVNDIYVDKNMAAYAIIEFTANEFVERVMQQEEHLFMFYGKRLIVRRREAHSDNYLLSTKTSLSIYSEEFFSELNQCINVDQKMEILYARLQLTQDDVVLRQLICELLQNVMEEVYPKCKVMQFGSSVNGLGIKGCDIDLTLLIEPDSRDEKDIMNEVRDIIQRFAPGCKNVSLVESSKNCTIVKFLHSESSLSIDLSLNNRLAIANTELLTTYINADKRVALLLFTVRAWSQQNNLSGRSGLQLSNYALTLMVVHFLQHATPPVLSCLQDCCVLEDDIIYGWNCSFCKICKIKASENQRTSGELLKDFFEYYKNFDYSRLAIVIHSSKFALKEEILESYHNSINTNCAILVQDPFKRSHNVAKNVSLAGKELFVHMFTLAGNYLPYYFNKLFQKTEINHKKRKQKNYHRYSVFLPNCTHTSKDSLLCCEEFVLNLLKEEFKLFVENKKKVVVQNKTLKNDLEQDRGIKKNEGLIRGGDSLKRLSEDTEISSKRCVIEENFFRIVAQKDTWTNRRKNQRVLKKKDLIEPEVKQSDIEPTQSDKTLLFDFLLHIEKGEYPDVICKINIEPCNNENNLLQFQTFFAVLKKSLLSVFH